MHSIYPYIVVVNVAYITEVEGDEDHYSGGGSHRPDKECGKGAETAILVKNSHYSLLLGFLTYGDNFTSNNTEIQNKHFQV